MLAAGLTGFGLVDITQANIETPSSWGDGRTRAELAGTKKDPPAGGGKVDGAAILACLCVAGHQATSPGLPGVFPPLVASEWVLGKNTSTAAILLHGISGALTVKGLAWKAAMPTFRDQLSNEQIAAVLSNLRSQLGNTVAAVEPWMF